MEANRDKKINLILVGGVCTLAIILFVIIKSLHFKTDSDYYSLLYDDIITCYPEYSNSTEYEQLNILREYVYTHTCFALFQDGYRDVCDGFDTENATLYAYELTHMNTPGYPTGGMMCGGISWTLMQVYEIMGWDSVTLDMALFDDNEMVLNSHVVCLVKYGYDWIVEDATFNYTITDSRGEPLSVYEVIYLLDNEGVSSINVKKSGGLGI